MKLTIEVPDWVAELVARAGELGDEEARMRLAIELSRQSVLRGGGPFGALVYDGTSGRVLGAGVNLVVAQRTSVAHAEVIALLDAQRASGSYSLRDAGSCELFASCDPCAMCLGATLWSGVTRLVTAAGREDAARIGFDEGPVFEQSYRYLERRGIAVTRGFLRDDATAVLDEYARRGGTVYNA